MPKLSFNQELKRKLIHMLTGILPLLYFFVMDRSGMLILSITLSSIFIIGELLRIYVIELKQIYEKIFAALLRDNEKNRQFNGATLLFIGQTAAVFFFEKEVAITAMLFLSVSDSLAALIGRRFGKHAIWGKSLEGSLTFFLSAGLIASFFYEPLLVGLGVALVITLVELIPVKINDNLTIPVISGLLLTVFKDL